MHQRSDHPEQAVEELSAAPNEHWLTPFAPWLVLLSCLLAYANAFNTPFLFDDLKVLAKLEQSIQQDTLFQLLTFTRRPLLYVSLLCNRWSGGSLVGYHLVNFAVHVAAGLFLYGLVRRTTQLLKPSGINPSLFALTVAMLWTLHPLQTESVTYIVQRCEAMMGCGFIASLYFLVRGSRSPRPWSWYLGATLAFWGSLLSKEVAITGLVVIPLFDRIALSESFRDLVRRRGAWYLAFALPCIWFAMNTMRTFESNSKTAIGLGVQSLTPISYLCTQAGVILHYLKLSLWPDSLCLDYLWPVATHAIQIVPAGLLLIGLLGLSCWLLRTRPILGWLGLSFFFILAPTSSFVPIVDLAFEHRMYLPLAPLLTLMVVAVWQLVQRTVGGQQREPVLWGLAILVMLGLGCRTWVRNHDYRDPAVMWHKVVQQAPHNYAAWNNLGMRLAERGQIDEAEKCYHRSIAIRGDFALTHDNLGNLFARQKQYAAALPHYRQAIRVDPSYLNAHLHLGLALELLGRHAEAQEIYEAALLVLPKNSQLLRSLARAKANQQPASLS